jgi:uncharacterized LabA/DUF88 family protein
VDKPLKYRHYYVFIQPFAKIHTAKKILDNFMKENERCALFIDGSNFHATTKLLNIDVDYLKLLHFFRSKSTLIRAYYYTALPDPSEQSPLRKLIDFLDYNGYMIVSKLTREYTNHQTGEKRTKGNMDMELALDMLKLTPHIDHAVLFSGDGDFCRLLEDVQDKGVRVTVVSSTKAHMLSDALRRKADEFLELDDIVASIGRS